MKMSHTAESDLEWFLGQGETNFMRSTTGPMLDRAKTMSASYAHDDQNNRIADKYDRRAPVLEERDCPVAHGADMQDVTAVPRGGQQVEVTPDGDVRVGNDPDHRIVVRYASVSRQLSHVDAANVEAGKHLRIYYGDSGARWGRTKHKRIFSLYASTAAGQKLMARVQSEQPSVVFLPADERLGVIAELQGIPTQSKAWRKHALALAEKQAWELYRAACACWLEVANARKA